MKLQWRIWRRGMRVLLAVAILAGLGMAGLAADAGQPSASAPAQPDPQRLVGRWVRPDGGYVLEVREIRKDGAVSAA